MGISDYIFDIFKLIYLLIRFPFIKIKNYFVSKKKMLCSFGFHNYTKPRFVSYSALSNVRDWSKICRYCGNKVTWVQAKRTKRPRYGYSVINKGRIRKIE